MARSETKGKSTATARQEMASRLCTVAQQLEGASQKMRDWLDENRCQDPELAGFADRFAALGADARALAAQVSDGLTLERAVGLSGHLERRSRKLFASFEKARSKAALTLPPS